MQHTIHPKWFADVEVGCASCGATFLTDSTLPKINVEVCSNCHPSFTGQQKFLDSAGRVEKFNQRLAQARALQNATEARRARKAAASTTA
jgi:large subunit ribosomal protein L31